VGLLEQLRYRGDAVECPICGGEFRSFAPSRWDGRRWQGEPTRCPRCGSLPRQRLLALCIRDWPRAANVLHVAPEPALAGLLRERAGRYVSVDVEPGAAMVEADLTDLPFDDESFDWIVCSHVLEHIPDDAAAMEELFRVTALGGTALIQTPVNYDQAITYEDPAEADPSVRLAQFSQSDHVRVYGRDLSDRLGAAGFEVEIFDAQEYGAEAVERNGLAATPPLRNDVYVCARG
jgi:SAM-dependent methyltransferase